MYVYDVKTKLKELLTFAEKNAFVDVEPKLLEKPKDIQVEEVPISEATSIMTKFYLMTILKFYENL